MKLARTIAAFALVAGISLGALGPADAQVRGESTPSGATRTSSKFTAVTVKAKTPIDEKTKQEVTRRVTASWQHMSSGDRLALGQAYWGLYQTLKDPGPVPHITPRPPVEPPATTPCVDCGKRQAYPSDPCGGLRDQLKELLRLQILKGLIVNQLQAVLQGLVDMEYYGGVADLVANVVTTGVGLATAGGGAALGKAAASALKGLAMDQVKGAIIDALAGALPPPLDAAVSGQLSQAALNAMINTLSSQIAALNADKTKAINDLNKCTATYQANLKTIEMNNARVVDCMRATPNYCL